MLKLDDIVALAKSGYKVSDVKELIELSKASDQEEKEDLKEQQTDSKEHSQEVDNEHTQDKPEEPEKEDKIIDYKKKTEELEKKISELQKANTRQNIADTDTKSDSEVVADLMKSFM